MIRIWTGGVLYLALIAPSYAAFTPLYIGVQVDNISATGLMGYQISKSYAIEMQYTKSVTHIAEAAVTADISTTSIGLSALGMLPMNLVGGSPYFLFVKAGYLRLNRDESYIFPASVQYSSNTSNQENRVIVGAGAQYDFYQNLSARVGVDLAGTEKSVYLGAIIKF